MCDDSDFFKLFPGHLLWHDLLSGGLLNCLAYGLLLRANNLAGSRLPQAADEPLLTLTKGSVGSRAASLYFWVLPAIQLHQIHRRAAPARGAPVSGTPTRGTPASVSSADRDPPPARACPAPIGRSEPPAERIVV